MRYLMILMLLLGATPVLGATITGTAYTHDLQVAQYSVLVIDTVPQQRVILDDGTYTIVVPEGTYTMSVAYQQEGKRYEDELTVTVNDQGVYNYDFILFPGQGNNTQPLPNIDEIAIPEPQRSAQIGWIPAVLLLIGLVAAALLLSRKRWWKTEKAEVTTHEAEAETVPADLDQVIKFIKAEGGRTTQKELRHHVPCSEAKMSMMLTELEAKGKIERIKKGRGNLIVLK